MTSQLSESYAWCESIARNSGSSFYRSFALLGRDRRNAMTALYAFARLADNATDDLSLGQNSICDPSQNDGCRWSAMDWHEWIETLSSFTTHPSAKTHSTDCLQPIALALADSVSRFSIPIGTLHDLVRGVDTDSPNANSPIFSSDTARQNPSVRMKSWEDSKTYCHRVASSVGIACLSIWAKNIGESPLPSIVQAAMDCGVAFQMTNILRDIVEDGHRNRIYLPEEELARFGIQQERWLAVPANPTVFALNELGDWRGLIRLQIERSKALYRNGWLVAKTISLDGQRMFSLMWHSYRRLLSRIEKTPELLWQTRVQLTSMEKLRLIGQHVFTPLYRRLLDENNRSSVSDPQPIRYRWPENGPRVAVIGAGLAGINASLHLARHGCRVTLLEAKSRIGGRVGSFVDSETGKSVDYCQHVGMNCCSALKQWIDDTDQSPYWIEQDSLHFVSSQGKKIRVAAWLLPAPFHLAGILFRWPQLSVADRFRVGIALQRLRRLKQHSSMTSQLAIDWLRTNGQNERCIQNFWNTILVSALGEQIDRVTLESTRKVLIDGFATHRRAFHLLVPSRPLSELLDRNVAARLLQLGVEFQLGEIVRAVEKDSSELLHLVLQGKNNPNNAPYDAAIVAVPWNKVHGLLQQQLQTIVPPASSLQSSPITGIHTWWDRPWLREPHAILINRLSQWVFPAPEPKHCDDRPTAPNQTMEHYYQIVISASRNLPVGDPDKVLKMIKEDLAEVFPSSAVATMLRGRMVTDPNAVFSVSLGHESGRLHSDILAEDKIWIAGDWTATKWPATMEGALRSGATAAEKLLYSFGHDAYLSEDRD